MCYSLPKHTLLWSVASWHPLADTGCLILHFAPLCPPPSHTISSCQISPVTLGQVPTCWVQLSVSRHRQLLGKVTLLLGIANAVARELAVLSSSNQLLTLLLFTHFDALTLECTQDLLNLFLVEWSCSCEVCAACLVPADLTFAISLHPPPALPPQRSALVCLHMFSGRSPFAWAVVIGKPGVLLFQRPGSMEWEVILGPRRRAWENDGGRRADKNQTPLRQEHGGRHTHRLVHYKSYQQKFMELWKQADVLSCSDIHCLYNNIQCGLKKTCMRFKNM